MHAVPGSIQSIERAVAVLRLLASTDRPLGLAELAAALDLPRPTVHGIVRTLRDVEFVVQEAAVAPGTGWRRRCTAWAAVVSTRTTCGPAR